MLVIYVKVTSFFHILDILVAFVKVIPYFEKIMSQNKHLF